MLPIDHTEPEAGIDVLLMFLNNYIGHKDIWLLHELPFCTQQFVPIISFFNLSQSEIPRLWPKSGTLKCLSTPSITTTHRHTFLLGKGYYIRSRKRFSMYAFVKTRNWSIRFDMVAVWKCVQLRPRPNIKLTNFLWGSTKSTYLRFGLNVSLKLKNRILNFDLIWVKKMCSAKTFQA